MKQSTAQASKTFLYPDERLNSGASFQPLSQSANMQVKKKYVDLKRYFFKTATNSLRRLSLKTKWTIYTFVFIISFSCILVSFFISTGKRDLEKELKRWSTSLIKNLAYSVYDDILLEKYVTLRSYLLGIMNHREILYLAILDENGLFIAIDDPNSILTTPLINHSLNDSFKEISKLITPEGAYYFHLVEPIRLGAKNNLLDKKIHSSPRSEVAKGAVETAPIQNSDKRIGTVILGVSFENLDTKLAQMRNRAIYITSVIALVFMAVVFWGVERITAPIKNLDRAAKKIALGDLTHFVENYRVDEIGSLANSFNEMVGELKRSKDIEQLYTGTLERQVNDRTRKLKKSEEKYRTLFEHSGTAVILMDDADKISMVNRRFEELSRYSKEEIETDYLFSSFFVREDQRKIKEYFLHDESEPRRRGIMNYECNLIDRFSHYKKINLTMTQIPDSKYFLASLTDITELKELQKRLIRSEQLAAIGQLSAAIAHEIRNPLGAINTSVGILKSALRLSGEDRELMEIIEEETMRLNKIIEDFLQFANPKKLKLKDTNINTLIQEMLLLFRDKIGNGIQKSLQLDHDLPPILVDPNQVKQVMINIIKNSIEAMPGGGALTIITRETQNRSGRKIVEVIFKDTGCGIDEFDLKKIFQPFYSTKEKGAGMGLAICERIIQNHGGEIKVESQIGKGAQFVVSLPSKVSLN